jgi:hypothetical protein
MRRRFCLFFRRAAKPGEKYWMVGAHIVGGQAAMRTLPNMSRSEQRGRLSFYHEAGASPGRPASNVSYWPQAKVAGQYLIDRRMRLSLPEFGSTNNSLSANNRFSISGSKIVTSPPRFFAHNKWGFQIAQWTRWPAEQAQIEVVDKKISS